MSQPSSPRSSTDDIELLRQQRVQKRNPAALLTKSVAWVYDFLAEDLTLLVGTAVAIVVAVLAVHLSRSAAGYVLFLAIVAVVAASLWRTMSASRP
jgi:predicted RND superfamily exporter protein